MISMSLLHDFGLMHDNERIAEVYRAMDEFGIVEAQFFPYWRNSEFVGGQTEKIKASIYHKPKGGALIVVGNLVAQVGEKATTKYKAR